MGKYEPLRDYLAAHQGDEVQMTFGQVERLVGPPPDSAREYRAWWGNDSYRSQSIAWQAAGWHVASVDQAAGQVVFARGVKGSTPAARRRAHTLAGPYVDDQVIAAITAQQGTDQFDRSKLLRLIGELNDNYTRVMATPYMPCCGPSSITSRRCLDVPASPLW
jgi:hypothetical protein